MDRLTEQYASMSPWEMCGQDKYCARGCHDEGGCTKGCPVPRLYNRLRKYEDTNRTPEQIEALETENTILKLKNSGNESLILALKSERIPFPWMAEYMDPIMARDKALRLEARIAELEADLEANREAILKLNVEKVRLKGVLDEAEDRAVRREEGERSAYLEEKATHLENRCISHSKGAVCGLCKYAEECTAVERAGFFERLAFKLRGGI